LADGSHRGEHWGVNAVDHIAEFGAAMDAAGLRCDERIVADGGLHRYKALGDSAKDGFYALHLDGIAAGMFGHWGKHPDPINWRAKGSKPLDRDQLAQVKRAVAEAKAQREADKAEAQTAAAKWAKASWIGLKNADAEHPYLIAKRVTTHGLKETAAGQLAVSVSIDEKITSLQYIEPSGAKLFLKDGAIADGYYRMGGKPNGVAYVCEGIATAASVREATVATVYAAFSCYNLVAVAEYVHRKYPDTSIIIVADNDCETIEPSNPGLTWARKAAVAVDGTVIVPTLTAFPDRKCDANDVHVAEGLDAVRNLIANQDGLLKAVERNGTNAAPEGVAMGDILIADRFLEDHGEDVRYCPSSGWLIWDKWRWRRDEREQITVLAEKTVRQLYREAAVTIDPRNRIEILRLANTYSKAERIRAMLTIARAMSR
jgi:phage/plasmid primase-like uncharacterized protein